MRQMKRFIQIKHKNMTESQLKDKVAKILNGSIEQWLWEKVINKTLSVKDLYQYPRNEPGKDPI